jgi:hypothetical protein
MTGPAIAGYRFGRPIDDRDRAVANGKREFRTIIALANRHPGWPSPRNHREIPWRERSTSAR